MLAHSNWFGGSYSEAFADPEQMMKYFRNNPVDFVIWSERPDVALQAHARILGEMLREYPASWRKVMSA